jgi:hypothetical protein
LEDVKTFLNTMFEKGRLNKEERINVKSLEKIMTDAVLSGRPGLEQTSNLTVVKFRRIFHG